MTSEVAGTLGAAVKLPNLFLEGFLVPVGTDILGDQVVGAPRVLGVQSTLTASCHLLPKLRGLDGSRRRAAVAPARPLKGLCLSVFNLKPELELWLWLYSTLRVTGPNSKLLEIHVSCV